MSLLLLLSGISADSATSGETTTTSELFGWSDWFTRIVTLTPFKRWAGSSALTLTGDVTTNGRLASVIGGLAGGVQATPSGLPFISSQLAYAKLQTRMLTITDTNVDQVGLDWFYGVVPRVQNEPDRNYASRLVLTLTAGCPSIPGLQKIIQAYLTALISYSPVFAPLADDTSGGDDSVGGMDVVPGGTGASSAPGIGMDTFGGDDTFGFMDQQPRIGGIPTVIVFDNQSDPTTSALIGLEPPQFCVYLSYPSASVSLIHEGQPYTPALDVMVRAFMAPGTIPIYASNST
jgi:hypothetical protein